MHLLLYMELSKVSNILERTSICCYLPVTLSYCSIRCVQLAVRTSTTVRDTWDM